MICRAASMTCLKTYLKPRKFLRYQVGTSVEQKQKEKKTENEQNFQIKSKEYYKTFLTENMWKSTVNKYSVGRSWSVFFNDVEPAQKCRMVSCAHTAAHDHQQYNSGNKTKGAGWARVL